MASSFAFYFARNIDTFNTTGSKLMGRQAANAGFLRAILEHLPHPVAAWCHDEAGFAQFREQVTSLGGNPSRALWVRPQETERMAAVGTLFRSSPVMDGLLWQREATGAGGHSIVGITHTVAEAPVKQALGSVLLGPHRPWDALVCTSDAVRRVVHGVFDAWAADFEERQGLRPKLQLQTPVIPLGVRVADYLDGAAKAEARAAERQKLGLGADEPVVLFLGRFNVVAKAHPLPMWLAADRAAAQLGRKVHVVMAGWFETDREKQHFEQLAGWFGERLRIHWVDGREAARRPRVWAAADVFLSLVDNVQETFGLTPIEAMAAGLPAVVSDWNGYKETVRDGVDGFRVPTLAPPRGFGESSARDYASERFGYNGFVAETSSAVNVDLDAAADRLSRLLGDAELRKTMGASARERALEVFDWSVVIRQHAALWDELERIRLHERRSPRDDARCVPLVPEPWTLFEHYPSAPFHEEARLFPGSVPVGGEVFQPSLAQLHENATTRFGSARRLPLAGQAHVLTRVSAKPGVSVRELREELTLPMEPLVWTLAWMAKYGLLRIEQGA